jgi:hypothetical protein
MCGEMGWFEFMIHRPRSEGPNDTSRLNGFNASR